MLTRTLFALVTTITVTITMLLATPMAMAQSWTTYDPSLGTLPDAQGFSYVNTGSSPAPTVSGGILYQGLTDYTGGQFWEKDGGEFSFLGDFTLEANLKVISSTYITPSPGGGLPDSQRAGYYFYSVDATGRALGLGIASTGIFLNTDALGSAANGITFKSFDTTDAFHQYRLVVTQGIASVYIDNALYGSTAVGSSVGATNQVWFGDGTGAGASQTQLASLRYMSGLAVVPEPGTIFLLLTGGLVGGVQWIRRRRK